MSASRPGSAREILFEFVQVGAQMRVAAVDSATGLEAVVIAPANAARVDLERLALRKLQRLLGEEENGEAEQDEGEKPARPGTIA